MTEINRQTKFEDLPEWISPSDLAAWLDISPGSVYTRIKEGRLRAVKLGGLRISKDVLKAYLEQQEKAPCHAH